MGKELELAIKISGKLDKSLSSAVHSAQAQLNSIAKVTNRAMTIATAAVAAAGVKIVKDSIQTYQGYQSALNSAAATGNIARGTAEYEAMNKAAREAGRTTVKTAKESANALEYMMLAGWSVENSTKALMPVLKLSASTGADLAITSDLVTDSMANLGLTINDLPHYLDVAAAANNKTNQTATQLQEAYLGVGGTLKNINAPIEESAAILGVLANRGTKGSEAGTALSAILVNMQKRSGEANKAMSRLGVSMYDANGNARSIIDVFRDINDKTAGMTEQNRNLMYQMIGGKSHVDSFSKIMQGFSTQTADGATEVYSLVDAFKNCDGALDKLYDIKMDTLEGSAFRLSSAFDDMKISIGERLAPTLQGAFDNLANKMPQIGEVIISTLEKIIPAASKMLNYLVNNSDKAVSGAIKMVKAFAMFKIGTGMVKSIDGTVKLVNNLNKISKAVGGLKMLKGVIGTFTGIGTAAGTAGGVITGVLSSALSSIASVAAATVLPLVAVTAAIEGMIYVRKKYNAYKFYKQNKFAEGMNKRATAIAEATESLIKYNNMAAEVANLRAIINNPTSSFAEIENAKSRLEEIATLLSQEYNLVINADTSSLENAVNLAQQKSRGDLITNSGELITQATNGAAQYQSDTVNLPALYAQKEELDNIYTAYLNIKTQVQTLNSQYKAGWLSSRKYQGRVDDLYQEAKAYGYVNDDFGDNLASMQQAVGFGINMSTATDDIYNRLNRSADEGGINSLITMYESQIKEFDDATTKAGDYLAQALASDVNIGDKFNIDTDVAMLENLGQAMTKAGVNTNDVAVQFSAAKAGYTDFSKAVADGKAGEMAQSFIEYQTAIGQTAETAVNGAALIQNGFQNVEQATTAGGDAINNILASMKSLGDTQGIFDGITGADGIADKLSDMAHAMNLIPENKSVTIDANGNFQVIEEAENQIASLKSVGNVDVSVNANGDFSILNEVTGEIQMLQGLGAVSLQVNASGNIDVLDKAQQVIGTIDSKNAQISVDGQVVGVDQIQQAAQASNGLHSVSATQTVTGTYAGQEVIAAAIDNQSKLQSVNTAQTVNGSFNGQDAIATALSYQSQLKSKSVTYKVTYKQVGTPPAQSAKGALHFKGGLTYINDQNISDPREVIEYNGNRYWYEGRNVLANVPKGARIYNATESKPIINGSHRNGLSRVPFDGYIAELHRNEQVLTADEASEYRDGGFSDYMRKMKFVLENRESSGHSSSNNGRSGGDGSITFSPQYIIQGNGDKEAMYEVSRTSFNDFKRFMEEYERDKRRKSFSG